MRYLIAIIGFIFSVACNSKHPKADIKFDTSVVIANIPPMVLLSTAKGIVIKGNLCYYSDSLYAGFIEEYSPSKKLIARLGFLYGQKQGIQQQWYENGQIKEIRYIN